MWWPRPCGGPGGMSLLLLLLLVLGCADVSHASWLYLGVASLATVQQETCKVLPGLVYQQLQVCRENPNAMFCVGEGVRRGIYECKRQFHWERWNCTTNTEQTVFGPVLSQGTKETAFIYAVTSAGVVHAVTQSCSAGNLTDCTCDLSKEGKNDGDGTWKWGGCSDNINYGTWFSRTFVDAPDKSLSAGLGTTPRSKLQVRALMNMHNNEVGRKVIEDNMIRKCRCHGVSGSCAVKTCWRTMPPFHKVGALLKERYEDSIEISGKAKRKLRRKQKWYRKIPIEQEDLVFMDRSPNYCRQDPNRGILGTRGRECNKTSRGQDSCDTLCCGRGYNTRVERYIERCHCKFVWCCYVKCKICETMVDVHTCK